MSYTAQEILEALANKSPLCDKFSVGEVADAFVSGAQQSGANAKINKTHENRHTSVTITRVPDGGGRKVNIVKLGLESSPNFTGPNAKKHKNIGNTAGDLLPHLNK